MIALWITNYHLALGHQVPILEALGVTAITIKTWVKDRMGRGQTLRGQTEHAVFARCGKPVIQAITTTILFTPRSQEAPLVETAEIF